MALMVPRTRGVVAGQEAHQRDVEQARVQLPGVVVLGEGAALRVVPALEHLRVHPVAQGAPVVDGSVEPVLLDRLDRPVEGDPDHHPGVGEVAQRTADLPDPVVRLVPVRGQLVDERALQRPALRRLLEPAVAGVLEGDHHLAEHVGLALVHGAVADAHRAGAGVAGEVVELALGELAATVDAVHDLEVLGVSRDRPQQPVAPAPRLVGVAGPDERLEREGRVAQPAEAVVPVAFAAEVLRERGGRSRHDAPGLVVGHQAQGEQAATDQVAVGDVGGAGERPALVLDPGRLDAVVEGDRLGQLVPGPHPGGGERHGLAGREVELVGVVAVHGARETRAVQHQLVRPGGRDDDLVPTDLLAGHPRPDQAVVEAHHPLVGHPDRPLAAPHAAHEVGAAVVGRHHVAQHEHAGGRRERRLEDRAVADVAPGALDALGVRGGDDPASVVVGRPAGRRSRRGSRSGAGTASRPIRPGRPAPRSRGRRRVRSPRWGVPCPPT